MFLYKLVLLQAIGAEYIYLKEEQLCRRAFQAWKTNPNLVILGSRSSSRIPIFSFLIYNPESGKLLHHNYIVQVLNDVYGIQTSSVSACEGPYTQDLLNIDEDMAQKYFWFLANGTEEDGVSVKMEIMRPGFTRLNLPFFFDCETIDFVLHAVDMVAIHGWKLIPWYTFSKTSGKWFHREFPNGSRCWSLKNINYKHGKMQFNSAGDLFKKGHGHVHLGQISDEAMCLFMNAEPETQGYAIEDELYLPDDQKKLIWFLQPKHALEYLNNPIMRQQNNEYNPVPFNIRASTWGRARFAWKKVIQPREGIKTESKRELYFIKPDLKMEINKPTDESVPQSDFITMNNVIPTNLIQNVGMIAGMGRVAVESKTRHQEKRTKKKKKCTCTIL